jgi:twitching motility protein PilI
VAQRLRDLSSRKTVASKLGFQVGSDNWFVNLADVSEVIPPPNYVEVPQTQPWFRGVANIRGKLYSVADFSAFQGLEPIGPGMERRVILVHEKLIEGSALLVSRMLGLRNPETFEREPDDADAPPWLKGRFRDPNGVIWRELDLNALVRESRFLEVGLTAIAVA